MPYWPSSRVGIQPSPPNNNNNNNSSKKRASRQRADKSRGITMEDLKKQTALRLAQEQDRKSGTSRRGTTATTLSPSATTDAISTSAASPSTTSATTFPVNSSAHAPTILSSAATVASAYGTRASQEPAYPPIAAAPLASQMTCLHDSRVDSSERNHIHRTRDHRLPQSTGRSTFIKPNQQHATNAAVDHSNPYFHHRDAPYPLVETLSSASSSSNQSHNGNSNQVHNNKNNKSKMPHGLTVQELKEMTKARLQAEAATKTTRAAPSPTLRQESPWRPSSSLSTSSSNLCHTKEPSNSWDGLAAPSATAAAIHSSVNSSSLSSSSQSLYSSLHSSGSSGFAPIGTDSAILLNRSFEANRRRAATMSPRLGNMSIFEEEEFLETPTRERAFSSDPAPNSDMFGTLGVNNINNNGSAFTPNRARASSAASLPPLSHTSDEFAFLEMAGHSSTTEPICEDGPYITAGLTQVFDQGRLRAATWSESTPLFDDLASILKLSGASEEDKTNTNLMP